MRDEDGPINIDRTPFTGCPICGGRLVEIRGRYPGDKKRKVCPTCLQERMDEMADVVMEGLKEVKALADKLRCNRIKH